MVHRYTMDILNFGKHKGKSLDCLLSDDPYYLIYLASENGSAYLTDNQKKIVNEKVLSVKIRFGKHKGLTFAEIRDIYPNYLKWLSTLERNEWIKKIIPYGV